MLDVADTGAVFRANPDGTECEIVMRGLRNPEELCFNDVGDLFTGDNNADGGDLARWVQVVEGGDAGWQIGWQSLPGLGAWIAESSWSPDAAQTALALVPPRGHDRPRTGGHRALSRHRACPRRGAITFSSAISPAACAPSRSSRTARATRSNAPKVALHDNGYELKNKLVWGFYPTDVDFGVEGGVYVLDWVRDEEKPGKGRIFRLHDPATDESAIVRETKRLLGEGMAARAAAGTRAVCSATRIGACGWRRSLRWWKRRTPPCLREVARNGGDALARLHAVWGLGQLGRKSPAELAPIVALLKDDDSEVRAQAAKVLGDARFADAAPQLVAALEDAAPRVRFFAALALGKLRCAHGGARTLAMLGKTRTAMHSSDTPR